MPPDDPDATTLVNVEALLAYMRRVGTVCVCEIMQRFCIESGEAMEIMAVLERAGGALVCQDDRCVISPAAWKAR